MDIEARTYSTLIVSAPGKFADSLTELLSDTPFRPIKRAGNVSAARRAVLENEFDIIIINSPLSDENGYEFAGFMCSSAGAGVLLFVTGDIYDEISAKAADDGIFTLPKPSARQNVIQTLRMLRASRERCRRYEKQYSTLEEKMSEIRTVNRAKWLLIDYLKMTEVEAHRFIEKQAMDMRITKRAAAENIIKTYGK